MKELGAVIRNLLERSHLIQAELRFSSPDVLTAPVPSGNASSPDADKHEPPNQDRIVPHLSTLNLTEREQQVLDLLTKGLSNPEIGSELHLSPRTIEKYVSSLLRKTETNNRAELVRFALENHLVQ
jgi:DNA-binding NarL/FixJ family response regulator